jgi:two-component sensor histidine kinase
MKYIVWKVFSGLAWVIVFTHLTVTAATLTFIKDLRKDNRMNRGVTISLDDKFYGKPLFLPTSEIIRIMEQGLKLPSMTTRGSEAVSGRTLLLNLAVFIVSSFGIIFGSLFLLIVILGILVFNTKSRAARHMAFLKKELEDKSHFLDLANDERDWLIKEIHHRVKNNLQIVLSLLNTQLSYLRNDEAIKAIQNSQHRMYAISLVHQKLYQTSSVSNINMVVYIRELVEYLKDAYDVEGKVTFSFDLVPLDLDVNLALPLGLIINEAINNALKYAFPGETRGNLKIRLNSVKKDKYTFSIADDGIGLSHDYDLRPVNSFGKNLMAGLANQLGGTYEMKNNGGVEVIVEFNIANKTNHNIRSNK